MSLLENGYILLKGINALSVWKNIIYYSIKRLLKSNFRPKSVSISGNITLEVETPVKYQDFYVNILNLKKCSVSEPE